MKPCSRREFMSKSLCAAAAAGTVGALAGCPKAPVTPVDPTTKVSRVFAVRGRDLYEMTRQALAHWGGAEAMVNPGETVFIKPNLMGAGIMKVEGNLMQRGECTKMEIVMAAAEECLKAGAGKVIIGDGAQADSWSWATLPSLDGTTNYEAEAARLNTVYGDKVRLACLESDTPAWIEVPSPYSGLGTIKVSSLVYDADKIISIPVAKTHFITKVSFSLKNLLGVSPSLGISLGSIKSRMNLHSAPGGVQQSFVDIAAALQPHFAIIDFSIGLEGNGPGNLGGCLSNSVDMRERLGDFLLLSSDDLVAADATATRVIGQEPLNIKYIKLAYNQGLGQAQKDLITVEGETLDSLVVDWKPATFGKSIPPEALNIPPYNPLYFPQDI